MLQIETIDNRDTAFHNALACNMLYYGLIGSQQPEQGEMAACFQGFQMPCPNGFDFREVCWTLRLLQLTN